MAGHKKKKKNQSRLTFEPVGPAGSSSNPGQFSPAKVRYSGAASSSPSRPSPSAMPSSLKRKSRSSGRAKASQSRLDDSLAPRPAMFMPQIHGSGRKRPAGADSSDDSAAEVGDAGYDEEDVDDLLPMQNAGKSQPPMLRDSDDEVLNPHVGSSAKSNIPRSSQSVSTRLKRTVIHDDDDEDEEEDEGPIAPSSSLKRRRPAVVELDDDDDDDDNDDAPIVAPGSSLRRSRPAVVELDDSDSDSDVVISPAKKRKITHPATSSSSRPTPRRLKRPNLPSSSPTKRGAHRGHRSEKQKKMELLRRRRAGEKIDKLTSSESSSNEDKRGMYDTDPEEQFEVLKEFDDEEDEPEEQVEVPVKRSARKGKGAPRSRKEPKEQGNGDEDSEGDLDDFVTDDDEGPIGAPALDIPLEFTAQAHKPLKDQFPYVIEWLVHNRINPAFKRKDPVYMNAWRKLDDEFHGLASSKFTSAAWKPEFYRTLKGRPKMEAFQTGMVVSEFHDSTCEACGRSGHPATFRVIFQGSPYYKDTLEEVEQASDSDPDASGHESVDTQDMALLPATKEWMVGAVCCSNAETAHSLIHWKHALKEWVEARLEDEGWMKASKLKEREKMKSRKRRKLANRIVDGWRDEGVIGALYGDFKNTLENARHQATTGRGRFR